MKANSVILTPSEKEVVAEKNVKWYQIHQTFCEPFFWGPILITSHQKLAGMNLSEIYWCETVAIAILFLLNIKAGIWADRAGHRRVMVIGELILFVAFLVFAAMSAPWHAWLANCLWAIGFAFVHGADHSFLHENLKVLKKDDEHYIKNIASNQYRFALMSVTCLATGFIAEIDMRLPLILSIFPMLISVFALFKFVDPPRIDGVETKGDGGGEDGDIQVVGCNADGKVADEKTESVQGEISLSSKQVFIEAIGTIKNHTVVIWAALFLIVSSVGSKVYFFTYNDYFAFVHLPLWVYGLVFFLINVASALIARYAKYIVPKGKEVAGGIVLVVIMGIIPVLQGMWPCMVFAFLPVLQTFSRCLTGPIVSHVIHNVSKDSSRATTQSVIGSIKDVVSIIVLAIFGVVTKIQSIDNILIGLGIAILLGGVALMFVNSRIHKNKLQ